MNQEQFPTKYNWFALSPVVAQLITWLTHLAFQQTIYDEDGAYTGSMFPLLTTGIMIVVEAVALGLLIFLYVKQIKFITRNYPTKKFLPQYLLIGGSALATTLAAGLGDLSGAAAFDGTPEYGGSLLFGALLGTMLSTASLFGCIIGNMLYIKTKGAATWQRIISILAYVIAWIITAIAAYFAYAITYTMHDPSSE